MTIATLREGIAKPPINRAILFRARNRRIIHLRESRWSTRSEKYINYVGSSGGDGGGGGLWRRDCKLVRIKVMNINHGRLVLCSFPALDGLSPLHTHTHLTDHHDHTSFSRFLTLLSILCSLPRGEFAETPVLPARTHSRSQALRSPSFLSSQV